MPKSALKKIEERHRILEAARRSGTKLSASQKVFIAEFSPKEIEEYFDRGIGACFLRYPQLGDMVANALQFWDGKRYRLIAWCVMPNHVHVIFRSLPGQELAKIIRSWKLFTARKANRILGRSGAFWQREYYDRLIRKDGELDRAIQYVLSNPERAGLTGWKWLWCAGMDTRTTAGLETGGTVASASESLGN
ncbi:MAG: transposase [Terracidiphilus sp.]